MVYQFVFYVNSLLSQCDAYDKNQSIYCSYYTVTAVAVIFSACFGAGLGGYFVLQNSYISQCSQEAQNSDLLFGVGYILMGFAFLIGTFYSQALIQLLGPFKLFLVMGTVQIVLSLMFLFVQQPTQSEKSKVAVNSSDSEVSNITSESPTKPIAISHLNNQAFSQLSFTEQLKGIVGISFSDEVIRFLPLFMMTGTVIGFEYGDFYKFIKNSLPDDVSDVEYNTKTISVFQADGIAQGLGVIFMAAMKPKIGIFNCILVYQNIVKATVIFLVVNVFLKNFGYCMGCGFLLGFCDLAGQTCCAILIGERWRDSVCIYGIYLFAQNLTIIVTNVLVILLADYALYYRVAFLLVIEMTSNILIQKFK